MSLPEEPGHRLTENIVAECVREAYVHAISVCAKRQILNIPEQIGVFCTSLRSSFNRFDKNKNDLCLIHSLCNVRNWERIGVFYVDYRYSSANFSRRRFHSSEDYYQWRFNSDPSRLTKRELKNMDNATLQRLIMDTCEDRALDKKVEIKCGLINIERIIDDTNKLIERATSINKSADDVVNGLYSIAEQL